MTMFIKQLLLILLVSLALNGLFGYLSYHFYGVKQVLDGKLVQCQAFNNSLEKSAEKAEKTCEIADEISSEFKKEEQFLEADTDKILNQLDNVHQVVVKEATVNEQSNVAGVDDKLPDSIRMLTESACNRVQGKGCTNP